MRKFTTLLTASCIFASVPAFAGVTGTATFSGKAPAETPIKMDTDPKCKEVTGGKATTDDHKVKDGKLADVLVYVKNAPKGEAAKTPVVLDQKGCMYSPKVFGLQVKQPLEILNSDPTLHNIHAMAKRGEFNVGMPTKGMKIKKDFKKAEMPVTIKCDVHPWMHAYVGVFEHSFFGTTDESGKYTINGLPDGDYELVAWHPKLGEKTTKVKVAGGNATADFAFAK